jgi:hypothetical protein
MSINGNHSIRPGVRVRTMRGETDSFIEDGQDHERQTAAGTWGHIASLNHVDASGAQYWDVVFPNGAWVVPSSDELREPGAYQFAAPQTLRQCALSLRYLFTLPDGDALTMLDDPAAGDADELTGQHDELLQALDELDRLREQVADPQSKRAT